VTIYGALHHHQRSCVHRIIDHARHGSKFWGIESRDAIVWPVGNALAIILDKAVEDGFLDSLEVDVHSTGYLRGGRFEAKNPSP
jgi:hypothetical protein